MKTLGGREGGQAGRGGEWVGCTYKEANNPKKFTCILLKSSLIHLEMDVVFHFLLLF